MIILAQNLISKFYFTFTFYRFIGLYQKTPEFLLCAEQTKKQHVTTIAITCNTPSEFSKLVGYTIPLPNINSESSETRLGAPISVQRMN